VEKKTRSFGIIVITLFTAVGALLLLGVGVVMLFASQIPEGGLFFSLGSIFLITIGVIAGAAVYGLWSFLEWGRKVSFWLYATSIPLGVVAIFPLWPSQEMTAGNTVLQLVGIAVDIVVILYLSKPTIKVLFSDV